MLESGFSYHIHRLIAMASQTAKWTGQRDRLFAHGAANVRRHMFFHLDRRIRKPRKERGRKQMDLDSAKAP